MRKDCIFLFTNFLKGKKESISLEWSSFRDINRSKFLFIYASIFFTYMFQTLSEVGETKKEPPILISDRHATHTKLSHFWNSCFARDLTTPKKVLYCSDRSSVSSCNLSTWLFLLKLGGQST